MKIEKKLFGKTSEGKEVDLFLLENDNDIKVNITNFGGIISHILVPDKNDKPTDVVLGFDNLNDYLGKHPYFGAIVGRCANRIKNGEFSLNDRKFKLVKNNGGNHLHGGTLGFDKKVWFAKTEKAADEVTLILSYTSVDMEEGYPGKLKTEVRYSLNNDNEIIIDYHAISDRDTILNLTNHSYFNLNGDGEDILEHKLKLDCSFYTPVDETSIPTGEILSVKGTAFDFRKQKLIGKDWGELENGYDHNFILNGEPGRLNWFGQVNSERSGILMHIATTEPGVQLYTSNYVDNIKGKKAVVYQKYSAFCLETQHFPDSPNNPHFPSVILREGEEYTQKTIFRFSTMK